MHDQLTVGAVIANAALSAPTSTAAVVADQPYTFAELDRAGTAVAQALLAAGQRPGDVALVVAPTSFELLAHYVGCARAGVIFAPINPGIDSATLDAISTTVNPAVVVAPPGGRDLGVSLGLPTLWCSTDGSTYGAPLPGITGADPHIVFFTSGSTGVPKAVLLSHQTSVLRSHPGSQLEPRGPALCPYPLFHMAGWTIGLQQWHARGAIVFVEGTEAPVLADALRRHRIERFNAIPALWSRLADHLDSTAGESGSAEAFPFLRFADTGTSPTSVRLLATIINMAPNAQVRVFYGSSEAGNVTSLHHDDLLGKPNSCGTPSTLMNLAIADDGELLISSPLLFDRYLGDPVATANALRDGWFHTGDRAEADAEGYLSIVGRTTNVIRSGGESIDPATVEAAMLTHPAIEEVAVFGIADDRWGELVCAAVVGSKQLSVDEIREHLGPDGKHPLARHQHPRRVLHIEAIPRTAATKQVDRHQLRQLAQQTPHETER